MYDKHRAAFSNAMDNQFEANKGRSGFHQRPHEVTLADLDFCVNALKKKLDYTDNQSEATGLDHKADVLALCADVANLALIISWNAGALTVPIDEAPQVSGG